MLIYVPAGETCHAQHKSASWTRLHIDDESRRRLHKCTVTILKSPVFACRVRDVGPAMLSRPLRLRARERRRAGLQRGQHHHPHQPDRRELVWGHDQRRIRLLPHQLRGGHRPSPSVRTSIWSSSQTPLCLITLGLCAQPWKFTGRISLKLTRRFRVLIFNLSQRCSRFIPGQLKSFFCSCFWTWRQLKPKLLKGTLPGETFCTRWSDVPEVNVESIPSVLQTMLLPAYPDVRLLLSRHHIRRIVIYHSLSSSTGHQSCIVRPIQTNDMVLFPGIFFSQGISWSLNPSNWYIVTLK